MSNRYDEFGTLRFEWPREHVLRIVLDGENINAVSPAMHSDLAYVWPVINSDDEVRSVIVQGEGSGFSAGGSFELIQRIIDDPVVRQAVLSEARDMVYNIINCAKPIVSAIHGPAVGAGLVVAIMSDISIAGRHARILDGHTRLGVVAGDHAAICWPLLCGMAKAKYYLLTSEVMTGSEAERMGLVSRAVDDDHVHQTALEIAATLATTSAVAVQYTKHALNNWYRMMGPIFDASLAYEFVTFAGADAKEELAALRERRTPKFSS